MNNEPVAWLSESELRHIECGGTNMIAKGRQWEDYNIPLYTHPAKTLTDEEINEIHERLFADTEIIHFLDFARAILRKAQEK